MTHIDRVLFKLPESRELQFPAMGAVQEFVNTFQARAKNSDVSRGKFTAYKLEYGLHGWAEDISFFRSIGIKLDVQPVEIVEGSRWDMVVDMSDHRINAFKDSGKHASAVCNLFAGIECPSLVKITAVAPRIDSPKYLVLGKAARSLLEAATPKFVPGSGEELIGAKDKEWTGIIGCAGWETYLAAAMGLACIELLPGSRPMSWLSKWLNPMYRVVDGKTPEDQQGQLDRAIRSIESKLL